MKRILSIIALIVFVCSVHGQTLIKRHLNEKIDLDQVRSSRIKSIDYGNFYEEFDEHGNLSYEKGMEWIKGKVIINQYNDKGNLSSRFYLNEGMVDTIARESFVYNEVGQLSEVSYNDSLVNEKRKYKYNKTGKITSINTPNSLEIYKYDKNNNLVEVRSILKGEYITSGSKYKWTANYNDKNRLIHESQEYDKKYTTTWNYVYNDKDILSECRNDKKEARKAVYIIRYEYNEQGLVSSRKYYDVNEILLYEQKLSYTFY